MNMGMLLSFKILVKDFIDLEGKRIRCMSLNPVAATAVVLKLWGNTKKEVTSPEEKN